MLHTSSHKSIILQKREKSAHCPPCPGIQQHMPHVSGSRDEAKGWKDDDIVEGKDKEGKAIAEQWAEQRAEQWAEQWVEQWAEQRAE